MRKRSAPGARMKRSRHPGQPHDHQQPPARARSGRAAAVSSFPRRTISAISAGCRAARSPITKKVARAWYRSSKSRICGVSVGSGPSSIVSQISGRVVSNRVKLRQRPCADGTKRLKRISITRCDPDGDGSRPLAKQGEHQGEGLQAEECEERRARHDGLTIYELRLVKPSKRRTQLTLGDRGSIDQISEIVPRPSKINHTSASTCSALRLRQRSRTRR